MALLYNYTMTRNKKDNVGNFLSLSNVISVCGHLKSVSACAISTKGDRLVSSSYDHTVKLYDFNGMASRNQAVDLKETPEHSSLKNEFTNFNNSQFKTFPATETAVVNFIDFSLSGGQILLIPEDPRAHVFTRDGVLIVSTCRGDGYLHQMNKTEGHVTALTGGLFSKTKETSDMFYTAGKDGTIREWSINNGERTLLDQELICQRVFQPKNQKGGRTAITSFTLCNYSSTDPYLIKLVAGCENGTLQIWEIHNKGTFLRIHGTKKSDYKLEVPQGEVPRSLAFNKKSSVLACRTEKNIFVYQVSDLQNPVLARKLMGFENISPQSNLEFSPCQRYILACFNQRYKKKNVSYGSILILDLQQKSFHKIKVVKNVNINSARWFPNSNCPQIYLCCDDNILRVLFSDDPDLDSTEKHRGILTALSRSITFKAQKRQAENQDYYTNATLKLTEDDIYVPDAQPMFATRPEAKLYSSKRKKLDAEERDRQALKEHLDKGGSITANIQPKINLNLPKKPRKTEIESHNPEKVVVDEASKVKGRTVENGFKPETEIDHVYEKFKPIDNLHKQDPRQELVKFKSNKEQDKVLATKTLEQDEEEGHVS
eukprot:maker-scaffold_15-snap-gene-6.38-mRNA-1 protein AED:0.00 eAED:0.00 QI:353/1/1/1/1/1/3/106/599